MYPLLKVAVLPDSVHGHSALSSIAQSPFSQLRKVILQVLLLQGANGQERGIKELAMERKNLEVLEILVAWHTIDREQGTFFLRCSFMCSFKADFRIIQ